jgi:signal transduction histidine kinase
MADKNVFTLGAIAVLLLALGAEAISESQTRYYLFSVLISLVSIFFAWVGGGKRVALYVGGFLLAIIALFTRQLWVYGTITTSALFTGKTFVVIYLLAGILAGLILYVESPSDKKTRQEKLKNAEKEQQQKYLEYMLANSKLKQDLLGEANKAKDELQLLETGWKSFLHDIKGDLSENEQNEIYEKIISPFKKSILAHLNSLEKNLSFSPENISAADLADFIEKRASQKNKTIKSTQIIFSRSQKPATNQLVDVDLNKLWLIIDNLIRNSMAAYELDAIKRIKLRKSKREARPILISLEEEKQAIRLSVTDQAGGIENNKLEKIFQAPVLSEKRRNKISGQGSIFVKFFTEQMHIQVIAENINYNGANGFRASLVIPLVEQNHA